MRRIEVTKDLTGQKLWFRAPEGRPAATPSVGIKDSGATVITAAATTYVTIDPVNTTVGAAGAAAGASTVPVAATTSVRMGAEYRIKNALQQSEDIRVVGIDAAGTLYLDEELQHSYASGDALFSCEFYRTLQAAEVDTLGELFVATASYLVTGQDVVGPLVQPFDVVLHPLRNRNPLTASAIKTRWPNLTGQEWPEQAGEKYSRQRAEAWDAVCDALYADGKRPGMVVAAENLVGWALAEFAVLLQDDGVPVLRVPNLDGQALVERLDKKLAAAKQAALTTISWYDESEDEALDEETEAQPLRTHFVA